MAGDRFPKPYVGDVKKDDALLVYVPMDTMGIGARKSGMPKEASSGPKSLEHVGGSASKRNEK
jgi:hypothetical protein